MSPAGDRAWVTTSAADGTSPGHLVRVPLATGATHAIAVGVQPMRVALSPDGSRAYVTNFRSGTVSVVDTATETVIATPGAGGQVDGLAVSPDGSKAYVADSSGDRIGVLDTATNAVRTNAIDPGGVPRAIAFTPDGAKAYVIVQDAGVRRIDAATDTMTPARRRIPTARSPATTGPSGTAPCSATTARRHATSTRTRAPTP